VVYATISIAYRLAPNGEADTGSIRVLESSGASALGAHNIAARQLAACRLRTQPQRLSEITWIQHGLAFDSTSIKVGAARILPGDPGGLELIPPPPPDSENSYPAEALDERPRLLSCKEPRGVYTNATHPSPSQRSVQQDVVAGFVSMTFHVTEDGRVPSESITFTGATSPLVKTMAAKRQASCRYIPGRLGGRPVTAFLTAEYWLSNRPSN
jgi:hypothetical protein